MNAVTAIPANKQKFSGYFEIFAVLAMTVGAAFAVGAVLPINFDPAAAPLKKESPAPIVQPAEPSLPRDPGKGDDLAREPAPRVDQKVAITGTMHPTSRKAKRRHGEHLAHGKRFHVRGGRGKGKRLAWGAHRYGGR